MCQAVEAHRRVCLFGTCRCLHSEAAPRAPLLPHRWLLCAAVFKTTLCARTTPLRQTAQAALWGLSSARRHGRPHGSARGRLTRVYSKLVTQRERLQGSLRGRFRKAYLIPQSALRVRGACLCRCSGRAFVAVHRTLSSVLASRRCGTIPRFWLRLLVRIRSLDRFSVWMFF